MDTCARYLRTKDRKVSFLPSKNATDQRPLSDTSFVHVDDDGKMISRKGLCGCDLITAAEDQDLMPRHRASGQRPTFGTCDQT